jgi:hypothetical protein
LKSFQDLSISFHQLLPPPLPSSLPSFIYQLWNCTDKVYSLISSGTEEVQSWLLRVENQGRRSEWTRTVREFSPLHYSRTWATSSKTDAFVPPCFLISRLEKRKPFVSSRVHASYVFHAKMKINSCHSRDPNANPVYLLKTFISRKESEFTNCCSLIRSWMKCPVVFHFYSLQLSVDKIVSRSLRTLWKGSTDCYKCI